MGVMENDHIVTGFNDLNGDLLVFTTKRKGLWLWLEHE